MSAEQHRRFSPAVLGFAVLTVSDSRSPEDDTGGRTIREMAEAGGHRIEDSTLVRDDVSASGPALQGLLPRPGVDVVVATGGTGFSPRDLTLEAVEPLFDLAISGFGELFRILSYQQVGAAAMLSRAAAGLTGDRAVFLLPGSPKAVALALEKLILPAAGHLQAQARAPASP